MYIHAQFRKLEKLQAIDKYNIDKNIFIWAQ